MILGTYMEFSFTYTYKNKFNNAAYIHLLHRVKLSSSISIFTVVRLFSLYLHSVLESFVNQPNQKRLCEGSIKTLSNRENINTKVLVAHVGFDPVLVWCQEIINFHVLNNQSVLYVHCLPILTRCITGLCCHLPAHLLASRSLCLSSYQLTD